MKAQHKIEMLERQYDALVAEMTETALMIVEQDARVILTKHPNLNEFVMGMGGWFFTRRLVVNSIIHEGDGMPYYIKESNLAECIEKWDSLLGLTGSPMRFTAEGPVVRQW
jgi:hypothetical protein